MNFKKIISTFTVFFLLASLIMNTSIPVKADTSPTISYNLSSSNIKVGDTFDISVNIANTSDLYGASIDFCYDPSILSITGIDKGQAISTFTTVPVNNQATGTISAAFMLTGETAGVNATGTLFIIHAKALASGNIVLKTVADNSALSPTGNNLCVKLSDSNGQPITYAVNQNTISITDILPNDAEIVSSTIPTTMTANQTYNVSITVKNVGTNTWTMANNFKLGAVGEKNLFECSTTTRVCLNSSDSIAPGATKTFYFQMKAPATVGTYTSSWEMLKEGVAWFGQTSSKTITVVTSLPNDSQIISDTFPSTMIAGQSYNVSLTVKNTGTNAWTLSSNYFIGAIGDSDPFTSSNRCSLGSSDNVVPGSTFTFKFVLKAPSTSGVYISDWKMLKEGVAWFGDAFFKTITVSQALPNDASIISDTIPTTMVVGKSYNVSVTVKNVGTNTWTAATNYNLGALGDSDPFTSLNRITLGSSDSVAPGSTYTFNFVLKAPSSTGSYISDWKMLKEGVAWFGDSLSKSISVTAALPNDSQIVSDTIPTTMVVGKSYNVSVTVKNVGTNTWTSATNYKLGALGDSDPFTSLNRIILGSSDSVAPGSTYTFNFVLKAPSSAGSYISDWKMLKEGIAWFGDSLTKTVSVVTALPNDSQIISNTIPTSMTAGQSYNVSITVKNVGTTTWTSASNYMLGAVGNSDPFYTTANRVFLSSSDNVLPGSTVTFNFTMKAPSTAGTYISDWNMLIEGVAWFGESFAKTITVSNSLQNDCQIVSNTIPTSMTAGQSYNVSITVKNIGTTTWTSAGNYMLGAVGNSDPFYTTANRVFLSSSDKVLPGSTVTFYFTMKAPSTAGTYVSDWKMLIEGVSWFGETVYKSITVS